MMSLKDLLPKRYYVDNSFRSECQFDVGELALIEVAAITSDDQLVLNLIAEIRRLQPYVQDLELAEVRIEELEDEISE